MKPHPEAVLCSVENGLAAALQLRDASLVIYRWGVLVEFKTEALQPGLVASFTGRQRSWQIGPLEGHHCHLNLASVEAVYFDAEPVSCQGGRLNYTVWFLTGSDCGNPFRANALFSVTLNAPYHADGSERWDIIDPVYALHDAHQGHAGVSASAAFIAASPARRLHLDHATF